MYIATSDSLALFTTLQGDVDKAGRFLLVSLVILETTLGHDHQDVALTMTHLAGTLRSKVRVEGILLDCSNERGKPNTR